MKLIRKRLYGYPGYLNYGFWAIEEKKFWGWKEILTYNDNKEAIEKMNSTLEQMKAQGYIIVN